MKIFKSQEIPLKANDNLTLSCDVLSTGFAQKTKAGTVKETKSIANNSTVIFGPYSEDCIIKAVTLSGTIDYTYIDDAEDMTIQVYNSLSDVPSNQPIGPVWVNGILYNKNENGITLAKPPRAALLKISTFGDSTALTGDQKSTASNDISIFSYPVPSGANVSVSKIIAGTGLETVYPAAQFVTNCGVGGRTVATMVSDETGASSVSSRKVIDLTNNNPDVIIYRGGSINDLTGFSYAGGVVNETSYQTLINNHKTILNRLITLGAVVLDCGIFGYSQGLPGYPATSIATDSTGDYVRQTIVRFNREIKEYILGLLSDRVYFIDPDGVISDNGVYKTGYTTLSDGKHLSGYAGYIQGLQEKSVIEQIFGPSRKYRYQGKNLQTNPLFASHSSQVPTSYASAADLNCTGSTVLIGQIDGDVCWTREFISTAAGTVGFSMNAPLNPTAGGTNPLNVAVNDIYGIEIDVMMENLTYGVINDVKRARCRVLLYNAANANFIYSDVNLLDDGAVGATHTGKLKLHFAHTPILFGDDAAAWGTSSVISIAFQTTAVGAGEVFRMGISNPRIVKL